MEGMINTDRKQTEASQDEIKRRRENRRNERKKLIN
jgi:hypothetical protein